MNYSFLRIHHSQIVANKVLVPVIDSLRQHAKSRVHGLRVSSYRDCTLNSPYVKRGYCSDLNILNLPNVFYNIKLL